MRRRERGFIGYVRVDQGQLYRVRVLDVSDQGCRLENSGDLDMPAEGGRVQVEGMSHEDFGALVGMRGYVRWVRPDTGQFGVQFDDPLEVAETPLASHFAKGKV
ncbi:PilZ domain-containing protein [Desulfohalovibrio reitneri]|uniref:PilZ domain-containing protein n=1 Tax=Desulfohalovibrio reitneri TaxID=1307759 RepID=UPI0004A6F192|nr:PilZ domain-containing protein [Desulfohalovibrio reitneri]